MGAETDVIEYEPTETETGIGTQTKARKGEESRAEEKGEIRFFGVRTLVAYPISACEKIDKMFGSGGETIVHYMSFESGHSLFSEMIRCNPDRGLEELLRHLVDVQPRSGWGNFSLRIIRTNPPMVDIAVKNPPIKTVKGSQKHLIGSFWAGVLSRYFNRQLTCKNFGYDADKDEFSCTITV